MFDELIFNRLTDEQRAFVEDFDNSILVSASAGTGKTTTMIRKILYLILVKKIDVTDLLVVTYTTAAASKLKHDLFIGLQNALQYIENDKNIEEYIYQQMDLVNNADIGTIHAFCNKIIKKYFYQLGIDPNYSILSNEKSKNYLINGALDDVFDYNAKSDFDKFYKLYENFNADRTDTRLRNCILALYEYLICKPNSKKWIAETMQESYREDDKNRVWSYLLETYKSKWLKFQTELKNFYEYVSIFGHDKSKAFCVARIDFVNKILSCENAFALSEVLTVEKVPNKPTINTVKEPCLIELAGRLDEMAEVFKSLKKETDDIFCVFREDDFSTNNQHNKNNAELIYKLCCDLQERYNYIKKENNLLDFNDLEHYATMLCQDSSVVKELKNDYKYIFVDEYQDVNYIQDFIVSSISKETNLYMIGDVKQSIYRFRQSSPEIFLEKYELYKSGASDKKLILFNKNFRSNGNIINFVNNIFDKAINKDCVGVDYKNEAQLVSGLSANVDDKPTVNMSLIDSGDIKLANSCLDDDSDDITKREYEAKMVAMRVAQIVEKGEFSFKDIAILTRDKKDLAKNIWIALKRYNIPVTVMVKVNIFKSNEILVLMSLLNCVYNEANDIAFATLLKSPIIGCTDNDLSEIRLASIDSSTYYEACLVAENSLPQIGQKITKLRQILRQFRLECLNKSIGQVLREFVLDNYLDVYYKSLPDGIERECYINEFLNIVDSPIHENNLARLLDYLDIIKEKDSEIIISSGSDSVTLMTMHSSKGLDFPVVLVAGFGDNIIKNSSKDICINREFGIAVTGVSDESYNKLENVNTLAISLKNQKEEFEECVRLLYVALTRPKKELYITGIVDYSKMKQVPLFQCKSYFDIFLQSIDNKNIQYFYNKVDRFKLCQGHARIECEVININNLAEKTTNNQIILDVSNPKIVTELKKYHDVIQEDLSHISFKNSVTSILKEQEVDYTHIVENFKKLDMKERLDSQSAMELGTQYHIIMQFLDYENPNQDIKKLIDELVFENKINSIYLDKIDVQKIYNAKAAVENLLKNGKKTNKESNFLTLAPHKALIDGSDVEQEVLVQGVIDLSIETSNGVIIIDFKTNKTTNKEYLVECYKTQLDLYAKSYEMAYNNKVIKKYLYSFEMEELIEVK